MTSFILQGTFWLNIFDENSAGDFSLEEFKELKRILFTLAWKLVFHDDSTIFICDFSSVFGLKFMLATNRFGAVEENLQ